MITDQKLEFLNTNRTKILSFYHNKDHVSGKLENDMTLLSICDLPDIIMKIESSSSDYFGIIKLKERADVLVEDQLTVGKSTQILNNIWAYITPSDYVITDGTNWNYSDTMTLDRAKKKLLEIPSFKSIDDLNIANDSYDVNLLARPSYFTGKQRVHRTKISRKLSSLKDLVLFWIKTWIE